MDIKVTCYAGYRGEETPRIIRFQSRKIEVKKVLDRWLDPDYRYFKLLGNDEAVYILRHDLNAGTWVLTLSVLPRLTALTEHRRGTDRLTCCPARNP